VLGCAIWPNNDAAGDSGGCTFCLNGRAGWSTASASIDLREEKLVVQRRKRRRRICAQARVLLAAPTRNNETWTMDFLQDALAAGRKVGTLSIEDAYFPARGPPAVAGSDVSTSMPSICRVYENKVVLHFITPGRLMDNGYIESFHGKFREECLNEHWFLTLDDARETIESWRIDYNQVRPPSALGYLTPEEFATGCANVAAKLKTGCSHVRGLT